MREIQDRVKRASNDVGGALQPRVERAKRTLEASIAQISLKPSREIYNGDEPLLEALTELEVLRETLRDISSNVAQHHVKLVELSNIQTNLSNALHPPSNDLVQLYRQVLPSPHVEAQSSLSNAQMEASNATSQFALDMNTPMSDLWRVFEESWKSKISPLRRRYVSQKKEYLQFSRHASETNDELRRQNLTDIADSVLPMWQSTKHSLLKEVKSLTEYTISQLSEWVLNVAQAQHEMFFHSARAFEQPAQQAEAAQSGMS